MAKTKEQYLPVTVISIGAAFGICGVLLMQHTDGHNLNMAGGLIGITLGGFTCIWGCLLSLRQWPLALHKKLGIMPHLEFDEEGIVKKRGARTSKKLLWSDVDEFYVLNLGYGQHAAIRYKQDNPSKLPSIIPGSYGRTPEELVAELNSHRLRAMTLKNSQPRLP